MMKRKRRTRVVRTRNQTNQTRKNNTVSSKVHLFQNQLKVSQNAVDFLIKVLHPVFELTTLNTYFK